MTGIWYAGFLLTIHLAEGRCSRVFAKEQIQHGASTALWMLDQSWLRSWCLQGRVGHLRHLHSLTHQWGTWAFFPPQPCCTVWERRGQQVTKCCSSTQAPGPRAASQPLHLEPHLPPRAHLSLRCFGIKGLWTLSQAQAVPQRQNLHSFLEMEAFSYPQNLNEKAIKKKILAISPVATRLIHTYYFAMAPATTKILS